MKQKTSRVLTDILNEREKQDARWGAQDHLDGTAKHYTEQAMDFKRLAAQQAYRGSITWNTILQEEVFEALSSNTQEQLRSELVQVAAVAIAWIEALDSKNDKEPLEQDPNQNEFWDAAKRSAKEVSTWPEWKRNALTISGKPIC